MFKNIYLHSLCIKKKPDLAGKYLILIPDFWSDYDFFENENLEKIGNYIEKIYNENLHDGNDLIVIDNEFFEVIKGSDMYTCFIASDIDFFKVNYSNSIEKSVINTNSNNLILVGWDVQNYFGSASIEGYYPIDPISGNNIDNCAYMVNQWGLIKSYEDSLSICKKNEILDGSIEWFPVAIYVDTYTYKKIIII